MNTFSAGTIAKSADINENFQGLADGSFDETANSLNQFRADAVYDFVVTGGIITKNGSLTVDISAGVAIINGKRLTFSSVSAHTCTASKDIYVDITDNGDGTAGYTYTEVSNNASSPSLAANSIRLGVIQAGASITSTAASINQGQPEKTVPVASSIVYNTTDSLGNLLYPTDPKRRILGYNQITSDATATPGAGTYGNITGLSCPIIVPSNLTYPQIRFILEGVVATAGAAGTTITLAVRESTTEIAYVDLQAPVTAYKSNASFISKPYTVTPGSHTFIVSVKNSSASSHTLYAAANRPAYLAIELVK